MAGWASWSTAEESALFPGYAFLLIQLQWSAARWCPGVVRLVMDGLQPAKVSDAVIEEIRARERNGAIEIPRRQLRAGDRVRILSGPFHGHLAIYVGMSAPERVAVLLEILGGQQRGTLARRDVEALQTKTVAGIENVRAASTFIPHVPDR